MNISKRFDLFFKKSRAYLNSGIKRLDVAIPKLWKSVLTVCVMCICLHLQHLKFEQTIGGIFIMQFKVRMS